MANLFVDQMLANGNGDGGAWSAAFRSIEDALAASGDGDIIRVKAGIYRLAAALDVTGGVSIYGGYHPDLFSETDAAMGASRNWEYCQTVIDGGGLYRGVTINAITEATSTTLDGLTFDDCLAADGAGIYVGSDTNHGATIQNCILRRCVASTGTPVGGGIYVGAAGVVINGCFFGLCEAQHGAAVYAVQNTVIKNCVAAGCVASGDGGAFYLGHTAKSAPDNGARAVNCLVHHNIAVGKGGGIYCGSTYTNIVNCTVVNNTAAEGGGIYGGSTTDILSNSIVRNNIAPIASQVTGLTTIEYSNVELYAGGVGNIDEEPPWKGIWNAHPFDLADTSNSNDACDKDVEFYADRGGTPTDILGRYMYDDTAESAGDCTADMGCYEWQGVHLGMDYTHYRVSMIIDAAGVDDSAGDFHFYAIMRIPEELRRWHTFGKNRRVMSLRVRGELSNDIPVAETLETWERVDAGGGIVQRTDVTEENTPTWAEPWTTGEITGEESTADLGEPKNLVPFRVWDPPNPMMAVIHFAIGYVADTTDANFYVYNYEVLPYHGDDTANEADYAIEPTFWPQATLKWAPDMPCSAAHVRALMQAILALEWSANSPINVPLYGAYQTNVILV